MLINKKVFLISHIDYFFDQIKLFNKNDRISLYL